MEYKLSTEQRKVMNTMILDFQPIIDSGKNAAQERINSELKTKKPDWDWIATQGQLVEKFEQANHMLYCNTMSAKDLAEVSDTQLIYDLRSNVNQLRGYILDSDEDKPRTKALVWTQIYITNTLHDSATLKVNPSWDEMLEEIKHCAKES